MYPGEGPPPLAGPGYEASGVNYNRMQTTRGPAGEVEMGSDMFTAACLMNDQSLVYEAIINSESSGTHTSVAS